MKMIKNLKFLLVLTVLSANAQVKVVFKTPYDANVKNVIYQEFGKYPKELIKTYIDSVSVEDLKICGRSHAFTRYIELSAKCNFQRATIHHEMSSMFLIRYDLKVERDFAERLLKQFYAINAGVFKYNIDNRAILLQKNDPKNDYFYKTNYATTNFENDFNVIAEYLWAEGKETVEFAYNNPNKPVSKKIMLVLDFYHRLDKSFDTEFFKKQYIPNAFDNAL